MPYESSATPVSMSDLASTAWLPPLDNHSRSRCRRSMGYHLAHEPPEVSAILDTVKGKVAAALAMVACCGLSMAVALGVVAFSSTLLIGGVAVAVALGCVVFMVALGHRHHHNSSDAEPTRNAQPEAAPH